MPLSNCKVDLKLNWTKYCVLSANGSDNNDNNSVNSVIFTVKDANLCVSIVTLSSRDNRKL